MKKKLTEKELEIEYNKTLNEIKNLIIESSRKANKTIKEFGVELPKKEEVQSIEKLEAQLEKDEIAQKEKDRKIKSKAKTKTKGLRDSDIDKIADRVIKKYKPVLRKLSKT